MTRTRVLALTLLLGLLTWGAMSWAKEGEPDVEFAIANAVQALGANNLKTIEFSGSGFDYAIGQNYNGNSPWPKFNDKTYTRVIDFEAPGVSHVARPYAGRKPAPRRRTAADRRRAGAESDHRRRLSASSGPEG